MMLTAKDALNFVKHHKKVAIVGLSPREDRPSHRVATFLIGKGFDIVPINPGFDEILGKPCLKHLSDLKKNEVDWIDLFVNPHRIMDLTTDIIALSPKLVWCQIGVVNQAFNLELENAGIPYTADICPKMEWEKEN